jgi:hypothetical protein
VSSPKEDCDRRNNLQHERRQELHHVQNKQACESYKLQGLEGENEDNLNEGKIVGVGH